MKTNWKFYSVAIAATTLLFSVGEAFAQYGACAPACETSVQACAPSCEAYPTCEATCASPCDATCETTCDFGCYESCGSNLCNCVSIPALFGGVCEVVTAPFHWLCCGFTDGVFPDCGCAPRPPKSNCNPCDVCGNYQGGCNDNCDYSYGGSCGSYDSCSPCGSNGNAQPAATQGSYNDNYAVGAYNSYAQNVQNASIFSGVRNFGVQRNVNPNLPLRTETAMPLQATQENPQGYPLRSVSYEQRTGVFSQAIAKGFNPQRASQARAPQQVAQPRQTNVDLSTRQYVVEQGTQDAANARSFGISRPVR